ncbi:hypothetical protein CRM22_005243 [Opisthorchis felineus]|uniref:Uncharacterized protein n=1 Tax=Opisthorchis felineus TaxID=147828 RepID=A0A4S2LZ84_OPIFE|nr:hypothetical protein CRM22_005243 [Opisthorchis felineus]
MLPNKSWLYGSKASMLNTDVTLSMIVMMMMKFPKTHPDSVIDEPPTTARYLARQRRWAWGLCKFRHNLRSKLASLACPVDERCSWIPRMIYEAAKYIFTKCGCI